MKQILLITVLLFLVACASQRQKAVCSEIEYRLESLGHSADQRAFIEEELRQCKTQQKEYAESDVLTNKAKKGIYEQFEESKENENP